MRRITRIMYKESHCTHFCGPSRSGLNFLTVFHQSVVLLFFHTLSLTPINIFTASSSWLDFNAATHSSSSATTFYFRCPDTHYHPAQKPHSSVFTARLLSLRLARCVHVTSSNSRWFSFLWLIQGAARHLCISLEESTHAKPSDFSIRKSCG
jgi:hypothetical protein